MFKFEIRYYFENGGDQWRQATVFAEDLAQAVEKIEAVDPEYSDVARVNYEEKPNWRTPEDTDPHIVAKQ